VTVSAVGRESEARSILQQHGAYDATQRQAPTSSSLESSRIHGASALNTSTDACQTSASKSATTKPANQPMHAASASGQSGTVRAVEENLKVHKTPVEGEVRVYKETHTEQKRIDVPVEHEEVVIERRTPGTHAGSVDSGRQEIRIPVKSEEVSVEKVPVVKEEVSVSKRRSTGKEQVNETLRKESIKVERHGDAEIRDDRRKS
jgi:uncharacterized protein (TIGR02271 family)